MKLHLKKEIVKVSKVNKTDIYLVCLFLKIENLFFVMVVIFYFCHFQFSTE